VVEIISSLWIKDTVTIGLIAKQKIKEREFNKIEFVFEKNLKLESYRNQVHNAQLEALILNLLMVKV
jgi:hypothetical protein